MSTDSKLAAYNYCVSFIDLLGQRDVLQGQGLLQPHADAEQEQVFHNILKNSIGAIYKLQQRAEDILGPLLSNRADSPLRAELSPEQRPIWDEMNLTRITTQRWSDGLVSFACLGDQDVKCHVNSVYGLFSLAGTLCLLGLASKSPIRGGIEIAWGIELRPGELYGPAVARPYELESIVAQYPRIVVGPLLLQFLGQHANNQEQDLYSQVDRNLAQMCRDMLIEDVDGHVILHYLGEAFRNAMTQSVHTELCNLAGAFVVEQFSKHRADQNTKLVFRYAQLLEYFNAHPPAKAE